MNHNYEKLYREYIVSRMQYALENEGFTQTKDIATELLKLYKDLMIFIKKANAHKDDFAKTLAENDQATIDETTSTFVREYFQLLQRYQGVLTNMERQGLFHVSFNQNCNLFPDAEVFLQRIFKSKTVVSQNTHVYQNIGTDNHISGDFDFLGPLFAIIIFSGLALLVGLIAGFIGGIFLSPGIGIGIGLGIAVGLPLVGILGGIGIKVLFSSIIKSINNRYENSEIKKEIKKYVDSLSRESLMQNQWMNIQNIFNNKIPEDIQKIYSKHPPKVAFFAKPSVTFAPNFPPAYAPPTVN